MIYQSLLNIHDDLDDLALSYHKERKLDYIARIDTEQDIVNLIEADGVRFQQTDTGRTSNVAAGLNDNAAYTLGIGHDSKKSLDWLQNKIADYENAYLELLEQAAEDITHPDFQAYAEWRRERRGVVMEKALGIRRVGEDEPYVELPSIFRKDWLALSVNGTRLDQLPEVRQWWIDYRTDQEGEDAARIGYDGWREGPIPELHQKVVRYETKVSSYNKDAFVSYGLNRGENAWLTQRTAARITRVMNTLVLSDKYSHSIGGDITWLIWSDPLPGTNLMLTLEDQTVEAQDFFDTLYHQRSTPDDPVYIWALEDQTGRPITRHFQTDTMQGLQNNLTAFTENSRICGERRSIGRMLVSTSELPEEKNRYDKILPADHRDLFAVAINKTSVPYRFLQQSIQRFLRLGSNTNNETARAGLIRLYFQTNNINMPEYVDPKRDDTAYQLGRLFAILEQLQWKALGDVNATIADKYMTGATTTPSRVFPELLEKSQSHLSSLKRSGNGGAAYSIKEKIAQALSMIENIPDRTSVEERGRMLLGYYHEEHERFSHTREAKNQANKK